MWSVDPPTYTVEQAALACAKGMRDSKFSDRVLAGLKTFTNNNSTYRSAGQNDTTHLLVSVDYEIPGLSGDELKWLYKNRFAKKGVPGRIIYDAIRRAAPNGRCSYCQYGVATTLDHYVPKAIVPGLAIDPWNLIPACKDCNHTLLDEFSDQPESQLLHPYFAPKLGRWLYASVLQGAPVALEFFAIPDPGLPAIFRKRMTHQVEALELGELYSVVSSADVPEISNTVRRSFEVGDTENVRAHLLEMSADGFDTDPNNRRAVIYEALAADDWYCAEGFSLR